ncbi:MAG: serine/threonine protein kinase [Polyangiaceae bacterium]|nr:serine/threonine protein kinase [Polyangiaceae bacterium]NUQ78981.1 serine/threonine protein kinase [Polyangiaceae bacterium]
MKACSVCHRLFKDEGSFCPVHEERLRLTSQLSLPSDPDDPRIGKTVCRGRYQIWRKVADGGMGRVYQALDLQSNRGVALKILHPEVAADPVSLERFKREFGASASLPHDHIVEVLAFEETEDKSYALVMEYLEGEELRAVLKRDKVLPPERLIRMLSQVAMGLAAAHEREIVHRDLKPDNIFLCRTADGDHIKILDFGSIRDNSQGAKKLTMMGTTIGSPFYMSPEQAQGLAELDQRADVWSLAAIAYESLTGRIPFEGGTGPAILLAIMTGTLQPPSEVGKAHNVPRTLDPVMDEALAKSPKNRTATIGALADRVGAAYGLMGSHNEWAKMPEKELAEQIRTSLPAALEGLERAAPVDLRKMDEAFKSDDAFMAGSIGGPVLAPMPTESPIPSPAREIPKWIIPVVAGVAVILGIAVTLLIAR